MCYRTDSPDCPFISGGDFSMTLSTGYSHVCIWLQASVFVSESLNLYSTDLFNNSDTFMIKTRNYECFSNEMMHPCCILRLPRHEAVFGLHPSFGLFWRMHQEYPSLQIFPHVMQDEKNHFWGEGIVFFYFVVN